MRDLTLESLNQDLLARFPDLAGQVAARFPYYKGETPEPYVLVGDLWNEYFLKCLENPNQDGLSSVGGFINEMAESADDRVGDLLHIEVFPLVRTQIQLERLWPFIRKTARRLLRNYLTVHTELKIPTEASGESEG